MPVIQMRKPRLREGKVFVYEQKLTLINGSQTLSSQELSLGTPYNAHNAPVMWQFFPFYSQ